MQKHNGDTIKTSGHSSLEKYTSHFIRKFERVTKGIIGWEVSWRLNRTAAYWPPLFWLWQYFFLVLQGCSTGGLGAQPLLGYGSRSSIFSPTDLNFLSPRLYNNLTSTYFLRASQFRTQFNPSIVKFAPDLLISSTGCTCYLHRSISSFDSLAGSGVNMQQQVIQNNGEYTIDWN